MTKEKLYEALGELLYAVAMADGVIQEEERSALNDILVDHPWATDIQWSFEYEMKKEHNVETLYQKALTACHAYGPSPEYKEFADLMLQLAKAAEGVDEREEELIKSFSRELQERFRKDLERDWI